MKGSAYVAYITDEVPRQRFEITPGRGRRPRNRTRPQRQRGLTIIIRQVHSAAKLKVVDVMLAIKRIPHQTIAIRLEGLGTLDGTAQPPSGHWAVQNNFVRGMKDYIPHYLQFHSVMVYTWRSILGSSVHEFGSTQKFSVRTDLGVAFTMNFVGFTTSSPDITITSAGDVAQSMTLPTVNAGRNKITYFLSNRDQGVVWDYGAIAANPSRITVKPPVLKLTMENNTPLVQVNDVYVDVHATRWGYHTAPQVSSKPSVLEMMEHCLEVCMLAENHFEDKVSSGRGSDVTSVNVSSINMDYGLYYIYCIMLYITCTVTCCTLYGYLCLYISACFDSYDEL